MKFSKIILTISDILEAILMVATVIDSKRIKNEKDIHD